MARKKGSRSRQHLLGWNNPSAKDILAGKIRYEDYKTTPPFTELLDHVMRKRVGFAFEQEVRLLRLDEDHYGKLCNRTTDENILFVCRSPGA
ncbi:MAG: hypothetical protein ACRD98_03495 [Nitrososphaera sp.]